MANQELSIKEETRKAIEKADFSELYYPLYFMGIFLTSIINVCIFRMLKNSGINNGYIHLAEMVMIIDFVMSAVLAIRTVIFCFGDVKSICSGTTQNIILGFIDANSVPTVIIVAATFIIFSPFTLISLYASRKKMYGDMATLPLTKEELEKLNITSVKEYIDFIRPYFLSGVDNYFNPVKKFYSVMFCTPEERKPTVLWNETTSTVANLVNNNILDLIMEQYSNFTMEDVIEYASLSSDHLYLGTTICDIRSNFIKANNVESQDLRDMYIKKLRGNFANIIETELKTK